MSIDQRRMQAGNWWLAELTRRLHAYVSKPDAGNLANLNELCRQYGQQVAEGSVECPLIR